MVKGLITTINGFRTIIKGLRTIVKGLCNINMMQNDSRFTFSKGPLLDLEKELILTL